MRVEIQKDLELTDSESALLEMHSFLNVMNVLQAELLMLGYLAEDEQALRLCLKRCEHIIEALSDRSRALTEAADIEAHEQAVLADVDALMRQTPRLEENEQARLAVANVRSVFRVLRVRVRELLARAEAPEAWERHDVNELEANFAQVLGAIQQNSKGRYRFVTNVAAQRPTDYFVHLAIEGHADGEILMPPVLQDVLRDLLANARKYTAPGGALFGGLHDDGETLRLVVSDTGRGIPLGEVERVVEYGRRASNVGNTKTMGGGFGLTKAYLVARQFGGRMWIETELGRGTRVEIALPSRSGETRG
jgi:signal transduction histidine kinase